MLIKEFNKAFVRAWVDLAPYSKIQWTMRELDDDMGMYLAGGEL